MIPEPGRQWRTIDWLPDCEVSEDGQFRRDGKQINGYVTKKGYLTYSVRQGQKPRLRLWAHRLVCEAWHGPCPPGKSQVAHNDGDKLNNHFSNLRWASALENNEDRRRHGTLPIGERHPRARFTWEQVATMRQLYADGITTAEIARRASAPYWSVAGVLKHRVWKERANA